MFKKIIAAGIISGILVMNLQLSAQIIEDNMLSTKEIKEGWKLLFNGKNAKQWRGAYMEKFPTQGWLVDNGMLTHLAATGGESNSGGDIITLEQYDNFEFKVDFRIAEGANSGIKYFVNEIQPRPEGSAKGLEFQILDDVKHPDAKNGRDGNRTCGSLYDLITANTSKVVNPPGEWNTAHIISNGKHVEHWLNGKLVVSYDRDSESFKQLIAISKYKDISGFGLWEKGHILLQDHGDRVNFKNIKIKDLNPKK
jgi:hypothetical protein